MYATYHLATRLDSIKRFACLRRGRYHGTHGGHNGYDGF
jgi:hypothetical protein